MPEPFAVLGEFSSGLQIVECTAKIISRTHELLRAGRDTLQETERLETLAKEYRSHGEVSSALLDPRMALTNAILRPMSILKTMMSNTQNTWRMSMRGCTEVWPG